MTLTNHGMHVTVDVGGVTCEAVASFVRHTFGGVAHWLVGLGCEGQLLAVYEGVTHRGVSGAILREQIHGGPVPSEVTGAFRATLAAIVDADWRAQ